MKKKYMKMLVINIIVAVASIFVLTMLGNSIIGTIAFGFWGEERGWIATNIIIRILMCVFLMLGIHIQNIRNEKDYNEYISIMKEKEYKYNLKSDIESIIKNRDYLVEVIIFSLVSLILMLVVQKPRWMFCVSIPLFCPINIFSHVLIHKSWIKKKTKI